MQIRTHGDFPALGLESPAPSGAVGARPLPLASDDAPIGRDVAAHAVSRVNDALRETGQSLQFEMDEDSGRIVVRIVDTTTKEVLRQVPGRELLEISRAVERYQGWLLRDRA